MSSTGAMRPFFLQFFKPLRKPCAAAFLFFPRKGFSMAIGVTSAFRSHKKRGAGAPPVDPVPLRVIGVNEQIMVARDYIAGRNRQATRQPYVIGQDATDLVFSAKNWLLGSSEENNTNSITIVEAALETASATYPILWSGNRSVVLAAGDNDVKSDPLTAAMVGLSKFSRDEQYWVKMIVSVPNTGDSIPYTSFQAGDKSGTAVLWYDSASLTLDVDATGQFPLSGVDFRSQGYRLIMLGHPVDDDASFLTVGDSIATGIGDGSANGSIGRGYIQRAMCDGTSSTPVDSYPNLNFGRSGIGLNGFTTGTKWQSYIPYARIAIDQALTNNVTTDSVATMQGLEATLWGQFRTGGIEKIMKAELLTRATSTDNWATTANQTVQSGWENGGKVPQLNTWFPTKVSDSTINYFVSGLRSVIVDGTATDKWAVPKTNNHDDTHPNNTGCAALRTIMRSAITTVAGSL